MKRARRRRWKNARIRVGEGSRLLQIQQRARHAGRIPTVHRAETHCMEPNSLFVPLPFAQQGLWCAAPRNRIARVLRSRAKAVLSHMLVIYAHHSGTLGTLPAVLLSHAQRRARMPVND